MTAEVIDLLDRCWLADAMTPTNARGAPRFDRTLRAVMWMDALLSVELVVVCVVASPIVATVGVPQGIRFALGLAAILCALLLAAFGAITAVVIMVRVRGGQYLLPTGLRLPLPAPMRCMPPPRLP